jgi:hypothetical protein
MAPGSGDGGEISLRHQRMAAPIGLLFWPPESCYHPLRREGADQVSGALGGQSIKAFK